MAASLRGLVVPGVAAILLLGGSAAVQGVVDHAHETAVTNASDQARFWSVVAGQGTLAPGRPEGSLASDLADALGPVDPTATSLPEAVLKFEGSPSRYGGVSEALHENPFDSSGRTCEECGPLTGEMSDRLLLVKQGKVSEVATTKAPAEQGATGMIFPVGLVLALGVIGVPGARVAWSIARSRREERLLADPHDEEIRRIDRQLSAFKPRTPEERELLEELRRSHQELKERHQRSEGVGSGLKRLAEAVSDVQVSVDAHEEARRQVEG